MNTLDMNTPTIDAPVFDTRRWNRVLGPSLKARIGLGIVVCFVLIALFAPLLAPFDPLAQDPVNRLASPSGTHWLGTDELGRDTFSRLIYAARVDLPLGLIGTLLPAMIGTVLGLMAGYFGRWIDAIIMRTADVVQAFPSYILVIALVVAFGQGATSIVIAFTVLAWVAYARLVRSEVVRVRSLAYVQAVETAGLSRRRILRRHVLPNVIGQTLVYLPSDIVFATLGLAAFSFLGLGIPPPTAEWGAMIAAGQPHLRDQWWMATVPGLVIVVYGLGLSLLGDALEEARR
jgi:peptide/nickel transport system permease protein